MNESRPSLTQSQLSAFTKDGYTILQNAVPAYLLKKLRLFFNDKMNNIDATDKVINTVNGQNYISNIEYLFKSSNLACLELLGLPIILETAQTICGPDFFLIQEFAVIKTLGDNIEVLWHQDMLHQHTGNCFTMGIYLDDADAGDGCLRVVPKSHTSTKNICELKKEPNIEVPVKTGDILIHDMMLTHSSGIMQHNQLRRVLYFEFLSVKQAVGENIYEEEQLFNRMRLVQLAVEYYHQQHPDENKFNWKNIMCVPAEPVNSVHEILSDIHRGKSLGKPSAYCFENNFSANNLSGKMVL
jgi:ectoine hydroxylase-related dioxygenase (phytanoyl-CoA dioxygenase family)